MPFGLNFAGLTSDIPADRMLVTMHDTSAGPVSCCSDAWPARAGALTAAAQAKLAAHLAAELAMLAGNSDTEPQRTCAPPVAAPGPNPDQAQNPRPRTRRDRAASAAPPAGWLRLARHLPAALRLALALDEPSRRESSGRDEDADQGGASAARATGATVMRHLAHVQHIAALLTATAPPPAAPAAGWDKELESRGAPAGGFFAVLGALNAARAGDAACAGGGSGAAGAREDALLAGVDGWRERARICQVRQVHASCAMTAQHCACAHSAAAVPAMEPGPVHVAFSLNVCVACTSACLVASRDDCIFVFLAMSSTSHPAGAGGGAPGGARPPQAAAAC